MAEDRLDGQVMLHSAVSMTISHRPIHALRFDDPVAEARARFVIRYFATFFPSTSSTGISRP